MRKPRAAAAAAAPAPAPAQDDDNDSYGLAELEDRTEALTLRSKRTERRSKKKQTRRTGRGHAGRTQNDDDTTGAAATPGSPPPRLRLLDLPAELLLDVATRLRPSEVLRLRACCRALAGLVDAHERHVAAAVVASRYPCLAACYPLPVPLDEAVPLVRRRGAAASASDGNDEGNEGEAANDDDDDDDDNFLAAQLRLRADLARPGRVPRRPYPHVPGPDPAEICTCLTCGFRWAALCLVADFSAWQGRLDRGDPLPVVERGQWGVAVAPRKDACSSSSSADSSSNPREPGWSRDLVASHAAQVRRALGSPLWHARMLEAHLASSARSVARHAANARGNRRRRFPLSREQARSGTDEWLEAAGPASYDFPHHRDGYYMLEAYMPNRGWSSERKGWVYVPLEQHGADLERFREYCDRARRVAAEEEEEEEEEEKEEESRRRGGEGRAEEGGQGDGGGGGGGGSSDGVSAQDVPEETAGPAVQRDGADRAGESTDSVILELEKGNAQPPATDTVQPVEQYAATRDGDTTT